MTCGIDGDDEYSVDPLPPISYQDKIEELQGRNIERWDASHRFLRVEQMILFGFGQNKPLAQLIPHPKELPSLKGRQNQQLDSSIHRSISIPIIPKETTTFHLYQKDVVDLTYEAEKEIPECVESAWALAPRQVFLEVPNSEDFSLEQLFARGGMIFDLQIGQSTPCKSWLKKVGHSIEKNLRKGAKKTCKFIKEHKTEIIVAAGVVIAGGVIAGAVYYAVGAEIAKDVAGAAIVASASQLKDSSHRRREEEDAYSSSNGPDPDQDDPPPIPAETPVYAPPLRIPHNATAQDVVNLLTQLPPKLDPNIGPRQSSIIAPQNSAEQRIFNRELRPAPVSALHLRQLGAYNRYKIEEAATQIEQIPSIKSPFGAYLNNRYAQMLDPNYVPPATSILCTEPSTHANATENTVKSNTMTSIIDSIQQALTTIGKGLNEQELLHPNTPQMPPSPSVRSSPGTKPSSHSVENNFSAITGVVTAVQQALTTIGKGLHGQELLNPNTPLDPFNYTLPISVNHITPIKHISLGDPSKEPPHMPILLFNAISLPQPPDAGLLPVLCPDGKLNWIVMTADWHKFVFSQEELENGIVHLDAHFNEFMPKIGNEISIVTSQNGMNVQTEEFIKDCKSDTRKIMGAQALYGNPSIPLSIGLYNPSYGLILDYARVRDEQKHKETSVVASTRYLMTAIAEAAYKVNASFLWLDLRHSEAGLIFCRAFEGMPKEAKDILQENLLSIALGPAEPISDKMAKQAVNIYSEKDYITKRFAEPFLNNPHYDIRIVACISPRGEFSLYIADHARAGTTYDTGLDTQIKELNKIYGFGEGRE